MVRETDPDPEAPLLRFARLHRLRSREESLGRCLHATVLLARERQRLALREPACFLHWDVRGDPGFREHWALSWHEGFALDMAAAQVDGDPEPLRAIAGYPSNYGQPRHYPIAPILACFDTDQPGDNSRYTARQILALHRSLMVIDLRRALRPPSPTAALHSLLRFTRTAFVVVAGIALEKALARLTRVLMKSQ